MDAHLPDELLSREVDRRYEAFGPAHDAAQLSRRARILRQALEPAWRDVHKYGPAWGRRTIVWLDGRSKTLLPGAPPAMAPGGYAAMDLRSVLLHLGEYS